MDGRFVLGLVLALAIVVPALSSPVVDARGPGGACKVREEYVTEASVSADPDTMTVAVEPGAQRIIECYY